MQEEPDIIDLLRAHGDQLDRLLSPEGLKQLDRTIELEARLYERISSRIEGLEGSEYSYLKGRSDVRAQSDSDVIAFVVMPQPVKDLLNKVGSVANSYLKKKAASVLDSDDEKA